MAASSEQLLTGLLKQVSRSFYLTMRVLPPAIRPQISLAYLLARTSDTIADTGLVPVDQRRQALAKFRDRVLGKHNEPLGFGELARQQASPAEGVLLERVEDILALLTTCSPEDQQRIREVMTTIISGQDLDLLRFSHASEKRILFLQSESELDGYTYRVAGCVGEFWTKMCRAHLFPQAKWDDNFFHTQGRRYGQGLQLINILRDLRKDLRQGRCYIPNEKLAAAGLRPDQLLDAASEPKFRPVYDKYLDQAEAHLAAGWAYTNALPATPMRLRLACAWPILIGAKTIARMRQSPALNTTEPVKISRSDVRGVMIASVLALFFKNRWNGLFQKALGK